MALLQELAHHLICPRSLRDDIVGSKRFDDLGSAAIEQMAMASFMRDGGFDRHLRKAAAELRRGRAALLDGLRRHCGEDIEVAASRAGMHVVGWLPGWSPGRTESLVASDRPLLPRQIERAIGVVAWICRAVGRATARGPPPARRVLWRATAELKAHTAEREH
jgi:DNA-binding transcriptional MocR family regulator